MTLSIPTQKCEEKAKVLDILRRARVSEGTSDTLYFVEEEEKESQTS